MKPDSRMFINSPEPTAEECNNLSPIIQKCNALFPQIQAQPIPSQSQPSCEDYYPYKLPPRCGTWDYNSIIGEPANTWQDLNAMCKAKGLKLCNNADLCVGGAPLKNLNTFKDDNWIATGDSANSWMTYNSAGNRTCKTHEQVAGAPPAWSTTTGPDGWNRAAKCCS
jgi:hypothetical protein